MTSLDLALVSCSDTLGCSRNEVVGAPRSARPTHEITHLAATVVVARDAIVLTALHAALLETGGRSRTGRGHCAPASRAAPSPHRGPRDRPSSRVSRSGNPRRRFDVRSKGGEGVLILLPCHTGLHAEGAPNLHLPRGSAQPVTTDVHVGLTPAGEGSSPRRRRLRSTRS